MSKFTELKAVRSLNQKRDCLISGKTIKILKSEKASNDLGIGSWAKIHFLVYYCFYVAVRVKAFH